MAYIVTNGLVLYLNSKQGVSGGIWNDLSGNGNNLTLPGNRPTVQSNGMYWWGQIGGGTAPIPDYFKSENDFTLEYRVNLDGTGGMSYPADISVVATDNFSFSGAISWAGFKGGSQKGIALGIHNSTTNTYGDGVTYNNSTDYFISFVYTSASRSFTQYVNGSLVPNSSNYGAGSFSVNGKLYFVGDANGNSTPGIYDNVRLYTRALSAAEISQNYSVGTAVGLPPVNVALASVTTSHTGGLATTQTQTTPSIANNGLLMYLNSKQGVSGSTWGDLSGNGNNATLYGNVTAQPNGMTFGGTSTDYASFPIPPSLQVTQDFTFDARIHVNSAVTPMSGDPIIYMSSSGNSYIAVTTGQVGVNFTSNSWVNSSEVQSDIDLYLSVVNAGGTISFYINGSFASSVSQPSTKFSDTPTGHLSTGRAYNDFGGVLDSVRLYNRALSATEVKQNYNNGANVGTLTGTTNIPLASTTTSTTSGTASISQVSLTVSGLVNYWHYLKGMSDLITSSGNSLHIHNATTTSDGISFNGAASSYAVTTQGLHQSGSWTLEIAFTPSVEPQNNTFVTSLSDQYTSEIGFNSGVQTYSSSSWTTFGSTINAGERAFVTLVYDSTANPAVAHVYINGVYYSTAASTNYPTLRGILNLASRYDGTGHFNGEISIIRVYNRALTSAEVTNNYNMGLSVGALPAQIAISSNTASHTSGSAGSILKISLFSSTTTTTDGSAAISISLPLVSFSTTQTSGIATLADARTLSSNTTTNTTSSSPGLGGLHSLQFTESVTLGDSITSSQTHSWATTVSDSISSSDSVTPAKGIHVGVSDFVALNSGTFDKTDSAHFADNISSSDTISATVAKYHTVTVTDGVTTSEVLAKGYRFSKSDSVSFSDIPTHQAAHASTDSVSTSDTISKTQGKAYTVSDTVSFVESLNRALKQNLGDSTSPNDSINLANNGTHIVNDSVILSDVIAKLLSKGRSDSISSSDWRSNQKGSFISDSISSTDKNNGVQGKAMSDSVSTSDSISTTITKIYKVTLTDSVVFVESLTKSKTRVISDSINASDFEYKARSTSVTDSLGSSDSYTSLRGKAVTVTDSISTTESLDEDKAKWLLDGVTSPDSKTQVIVKGISDSLRENDSISKQKLSCPSDSVNLSDSFTRVKGLVTQDSISMSELPNQEITKRYDTDRVSVVDTMASVATIKISLVDSISTIDSVSSTVVVEAIVEGQITLGGRTDLQISLGGEVAMTMENQDFSVKQGETKKLLINCVDDSEGTITDLTGASVTWVLQKNPLSPTPAVAKDTATNGITIVVPANGGQFIIKIDSTDTANLTPGIYWHEAQVIDSFGNVSVVTNGNVTIEPRAVGLKTT